MALPDLVPSEASSSSTHLRARPRRRGRRWPGRAFSMVLGGVALPSIAIFVLASE